MIESISDNPPAFPGGVVPGTDYHIPLNPGMTLRDWFAGQALPSIPTRFRGAYEWEYYSHAHRAAAAYRMADAMMAEREASS